MVLTLLGRLHLPPPTYRLGCTVPCAYTYVHSYSLQAAEGGDAAHTVWAMHSPPSYHARHYLHLTVVLYAGGVRALLTLVLPHSPARCTPRCVRLRDSSPRVLSLRANTLNCVLDANDGATGVPLRYAPDAFLVVLVTLPDVVPSYRTQQFLCSRALFACAPTPVLFAGDASVAMQHAASRIRESIHVVAPLYFAFEFLYAHALAYRPQQRWRRTFRQCANGVAQRETTCACKTLHARHLAFL